MVAEFGRGRDKAPRKKRANLRNHVLGGTIVGGIAGNALTKPITVPIELVGGLAGSAIGAGAGAATYGARRAWRGGKALVAKLRGKEPEKYDYMKSLSRMTAEFGRGKDKKKRKKRIALTVKPFKERVIDNALWGAGLAGAGGATIGAGAGLSKQLTNEFNSKLKKKPGFGGLTIEDLMGGSQKGLDIANPQNKILRNRIAAGVGGALGGAAIAIPIGALAAGGTFAGIQALRKKMGMERKKPLISRITGKDKVYMYV